MPDLISLKTIGALAFTERDTGLGKNTSFKMERGMIPVLYSKEKELKMDNAKDYKTIIYKHDTFESKIVHIILNRAEKMNAITMGPGEMTEELQNAVLRADKDQNVKVVIFSGAGENFSTGFDLSMAYRIYGGKPGYRPPQSERIRVDEEHILGYPKAILNCKKVTIAKVQGWCIEAGLWLAEFCDIAIAAEDAKFAHRGQRLAFGGMPFPMEMIAGHLKKHIELLITGRSISGKDAETMGIITRAVPLADLDDEVNGLAKAIALMPLDALCMGKACRKHTFDDLGVNSFFNMITYHTLATNITYRDDEKDELFIRDRENLGEKEAFHKLHRSMEDALAKTKYFKSYTGE